MRVYLAHVYGRRHGLTDEECEANVMKAIKLGRRLILAGHRPFIASLYHFVHKSWKASPDETVYFDLVAEWIEFCDVLLVGKLPEWEDSGVHREIKIAESLDIPVIWDIEELL